MQAVLYKSENNEWREVDRRSGPMIKNSTEEVKVIYDNMFIDRNQLYKVALVYGEKIVLREIEFTSRYEPEIHRSNPIRVNQLNFYSLCLPVVSLPNRDIVELDHVIFSKYIAVRSWSYSD